MRRTLWIVASVCLLSVLVPGFAFAEEAPASAEPLAPFLSSPAQPDQPVEHPGLLPAQANLCVQCTIDQERRCAGSCLAEGHAGGACGFCTLECFCFG